MGHKRTFGTIRPMSALRPSADIGERVGMRTLQNADNPKHCSDTAALAVQG
jgi:hypothetical protein